ncbi:MAG: LysR substrate-binding domain-containing protein [Pseudomonadota bacterium]
MRHAQLRAFHGVALHGGFSRAAAALNQTQPSLSDQVRRLEQAHDTLLFHRSGRQVRLTAEGEALFLLTRQYFELEDAISARLSRSGAAVEGTVRIVADSAAHITDHISRFRARYPRIQVALQSGNTAEVLDQIRAYKAEIGVIADRPNEAGLNVVPLGSAPIVAIVRRQDAARFPASMAFAEILAAPLIWREPGSRTRAKVAEAARAAGLNLKPAIEVEGREAMRELVASGAGIGFVSRAEAGEDSRIAQITVADVDLSMSEALVSHSARHDVPVIRAFLETVADS